MKLTKTLLALSVVFMLGVAATLIMHGVLIERNIEAIEEVDPWRGTSRDARLFDEFGFRIPPTAEDQVWLDKFMERDRAAQAMASVYSDPMPWPQTPQTPTTMLYIPYEEPLTPAEQDPFNWFLQQPMGRNLWRDAPKVRTRDR